jgi:hypothetical protein
MIVHGGPGASHDYFHPYRLPLRLKRPFNSDQRHQLSPVCI